MTIPFFGVSSVSVFSCFITMSIWYSGAQVRTRWYYDQYPLNFDHWKVRHNGSLCVLITDYDSTLRALSSVIECVT